MGAKLTKIIVKSGTMTAEGRIHIGVGQNFGIGGVDGEVVKNLFTGEPFIPGTSFKGKMRSGLETSLGKASVCKCKRKDCMVCTLFGAIGSNNEAECGKGRLIIKDINLIEEFSGRDTVLTSITSTAINRLTGTADDSTLRTIEAIEKGTKFHYEIMIKVYDGDDATKFSRVVDECLERVTIDGIGGKVSSGCGQVSFEPDDDYDLDY